jgi:desulfoferrodoxin (superoxide reductase-like protein)
MVNGKDTVIGLWDFAPTDPAPPSVKFTVPDGATKLVAYEWCTLHGLWKTDEIAI